MTDRELLEAAAKAAGYAVHEYCELSGGQPYLWVSDQAGGSFTWSGLCDDGDALRLAVKLNMTVTIEGDEVWAYHYLEEGGLSEVVGDDPAAATRRAIVRAAAALTDSSPLPKGQP